MIAAALVFAAAIFVQPAPPPAPTSTDLAIIGDSVIYHTATNYTYGYVDASPGRGMDRPGGDGRTGRTAVAAIIPTIAPHGWLVVELGVNDLARIVTPEQFAIWVRQVATELPDDRCLGWVEPYALYHPFESALYRDEIAGALETQPCHKLIGWGATAAANPKLLDSTGIHATVRGGQVLADLIYAAVGR